MCSISSKLRLLANNTTKLLARSEIKHKLFSSYRSSPFIEDIGDIQVKYEVCKNSTDWKFVERLFPPQIVPEPQIKDSYPSDWKPQTVNPTEFPYFISRTKNHMLPVYLKTTFRGTRKLTSVRKIQGDIWKLQKELVEFLQEDSVKPIQCQVNEFTGQLCFYGDHVNAIKYWLYKRNF